MDHPDSLVSPRPGPLPDAVCGNGQAAADVEWAQYTAWLDREAAAGREPSPRTPGTMSHGTT
jgi:hypothetical protein